MHQQTADYDRDLEVNMVIVGWLYSVGCQSQWLQPSAAGVAAASSGVHQVPMHVQKLI